MRYLLLSLFWCATLAAQPFTFNDQAFLVTSQGIIRQNLLAYYPFNEGSGQWVANAVNAATAHKTLIQTPQEQFFSTWGTIGVTVTDNYAAAPSGSNTATRLVCSSGSFCAISTAIPFLARQYTVAAWVKSNTGSSQKLRFAPFAPTGQDSGDLTATTSWSKVSFTFTGTSSGTLYICNSNASDALDLLIWGLEIQEGSPATANVVQQMDLMLSETNYVWSSGGVDFSGTKYAFGINETIVSSNQISIYTVIKKTSAPVFATYQALASSTKSDTAGWRLDTDFNGGFPVFHFSGQTANAYLSIVDDGNWHVLSATYDGTTLGIYDDGVLMGSTTAAGLSATTISTIFVSNMNDTAYYPGIIAGIYLYANGHSQAQVFSNTRAIQRSMMRKGITFQSENIVAFEGDSISDPVSNLATKLKYPYLAVHAITPTVLSRDFAVSGAYVADFVSRASQVDAIYNPSRRNVLLVLGGNDMLNAGTAVDFVAALKSYCLARKAVGWKVIVGTVLPRTTSGFNTKRNSANALIAADPSFYDGIADFAADATIGPDAAASNGTYYSDGIHPTAAGQAIIAPIAQAAIEALLP